MHQTRLVRLSKEVGWNRTLNKMKEYPTTDQVINSINRRDFDVFAKKILAWYRFLPSPVNSKQRSILDLVTAGMNKLK